MIPLLAAMVIVVVFLIRRWSVQDVSLALATGGLLAGELVGLKIVQNGTSTDLVILAALCGVTVVLLALFNWGAYKQGVQTGKFTDDAKKLHNQVVEAREVPIEHS